jgi:hypothetical protein
MEVSLPAAAACRRFIERNPNRANGFPSTHVRVLVSFNRECEALKTTSKAGQPEMFVGRDGVMVRRSVGGGKRKQAAAEVKTGDSKELTTGDHSPNWLGDSDKLWQVSDIVAMLEQ